MHYGLAKFSVGVDNHKLSDFALSLDLFYSFFFIDLKLNQISLSGQSKEAKNIEKA